MIVERRQIMSYDRVIKTRAWRSLLLVNPKGDAEVNGLMAFCPRLLMTVVWDPEFLPPRAPPTEPMRRRAVLARLRVTAGVNQRLLLMEGRPVLAAALLAQQQHNEGLPLFSGAVLAQLDDTAPLVPQLRAWAALIEPEKGALLGRNIDLEFRRELAAAGIIWRPWQNNLWLIDVKELQDRPGAAAELHRADRAALPSSIQRTRPVWETLERNLAR